MFILFSKNHLSIKLSKLICIELIDFEYITVFLLKLECKTLFINSFHFANNYTIYFLTIKDLKLSTKIKIVLFFFEVFSDGFVPDST